MNCSIDPPQKIPKKMKLDTFFPQHLTLYAHLFLMNHINRKIIKTHYF